MNVARILYPVKVLGPGSRIGIWLCGCNRACPGCSNPELWSPRPEFELSVENLCHLINQILVNHPVDGITITGGEPFQQAADLWMLISRLSNQVPDILVYSGYRLQELYDMNDLAVNGVLNNVATLVDGAYIQELNDNSPLRGSSNQQIHILKDEYCKMYSHYLQTAENKIQNFTTGDGVVSVGIHRPDFNKEIVESINNPKT